MLKLLKILSSFIILICMKTVQCDYYTSVMGLENLLGLESMWVEKFENYVKALEESNKIVKMNLGHLEKAMKEFDVENDPFYEDPLGSFQAIKRVFSDWKELEGIVLNTDKSDEYNKSCTQIQTDFSIKLPTYENLKAASKGLARLQRTYNMKTEDVANGKLLHIESSAKLTDVDCYWLGRSLYEVENYQLAVEWLIEARAHIRKPNNLTDLESLLEIEDENILEFLAPAFSDIGNFKMAVKFNNELLSISPDNEYGLNNKPIFQYQLYESHAMVLPSNFSFTITENQTEFERRFEAVCRGELRQTHAEKRNLRCRYVNNNIPFCLLAPFKSEELSLDPVVVYYHEFIYESEIKEIEQYVMNFTRSKVLKDRVEHTFEAPINKVARLLYKSHGFLDALVQRLTDVTGLSLNRAEALQISNYGIGGYLSPHHQDYSLNDKENRMATASAFLNNVEFGGATAFPILNLAVPAIRRSLLLWHNMHESSEFDYRAIHAGCPVLKGSKWIFNEWFHAEEQEFKRPCSMQQQGHKSIKYKPFSDSYDRIMSETKT